MVAMYIKFQKLSNKKLPRGISTDKIFNVVVKHFFFFFSNEWMNKIKQLESNNSDSLSSHEGGKGCSSGGLIRESIYRHITMTNWIK